MPHYSYLEVDLSCPHCGEIIADIVWFQWGYSPGYGPRMEYIYKLRDPISWKACDDGRVLSWVYFGEGGGANFGDPAYKNLIVKDPAQYYLKEPCMKCGQKLGGAAIRIEDGIIIEAWILKPTELEDEVNEFIINDDGSIYAMHEWVGHPMTIVDDC